jgi:hypothetical protein
LSSLFLFRLFRQERHRCRLRRLLRFLCRLYRLYRQLSAYFRRRL